MEGRVVMHVVQLRRQYVQVKDEEWWKGSDKVQIVYHFNFHGQKFIGFLVQTDIEKHNK